MIDEFSSPLPVTSSQQSPRQHSFLITGMKSAPKMIAVPVFRNFELVFPHLQPISTTAVAFISGAGFKSSSTFVSRSPPPALWWGL
ncbi:hypothetical protein IB237_05440 [Agrobacterium sp. AGB01]|uniref:hypothetical protein n=1 Tax=Agrobacterium sp. AGB01 TaxID=2769302 RepID=UPI00177FDE3F|nr:hypothetical protein [Agrobacterium sp. AGB01]MBD9386612.1 hypothetical protein [Agrobacterium sp. AGB01]